MHRMSTQREGLDTFAPKESEGTPVLRGQRLLENTSPFPVRHARTCLALPGKMGTPVWKDRGLDGQSTGEGQSTLKQSKVLFGKAVL